MKNQRYNSINKTVARGKKLCLYMLLLMVGALSSQVYAQANCSVNAGGNTTICGTTHTLTATRSGQAVGNPTWTILSKPAGADDPVIEDPNSLTTGVTGLNSPGAYVFLVSQPCTAGTTTSTVTITAPGDVTTFTAGPDITDVSALVGEVTLNAVVPDGYTIEWSAYNIFRWERSSIRTDENSQFGDPTSASTTFSLIKKADHDADPAYVVTARITSTLNPNCWYEDTAIVRFIPNPEIILPSLYTTCFPSGTSTNNFIVFSPTSPIFSKDFSGSPGSSGNHGTDVTLNVISQPAGGNIQYVNIWDDRVFFTGIDAVGDYVFTLTVENDNGSYTTGNITYRFNGYTPRHPTFLVASRPEQMMLWSAGSSGGELHCDFAGETTPITVYFDLHADDPVTLTTTVSNAGTAPPGGPPTLSAVSGTGTANRSVTVTPPAGGWSVGTYHLSLNTSNGSCDVAQSYYIHISDGDRPDVHVDDITVCYPGSGVVTATVPLPDVYKQVVNSSYFQDFNSGRYDFEIISTPAGAAVPTFAPQTSRTISHTSTTIGNLNRAGEYVFKIKVAWHTSVANFLEQEYACSDAAMEHTFSVFVSAQVGANAGSNQNTTSSQIALNGNNPGVATGEWTLVSKPVGAPDPEIEDPTLYNTNVSGLSFTGTYTFRWTITTGDCTSFEETDINYTAPAPGGVAGPDFWIKSDDAGDIATAWKDHSSNLDDIPAVGGDWELSPADSNHNFHPYTTGYANNRNFFNPESMMNPQPTGNIYGSSDPMGHSIFSAVRPTSAANGRITGIDDHVTEAAEPGVSITSSGLARHYEFLNSTTSNDFSIPFNIGSTNIFSAIADNSLDNGGSSTFSGGEKRLGLNGLYESFTFNNSNRFQFVNQNLRVGYGTHNVNGAFPGDIMEVIWYKRALTENEQSRVNSYLALKNGVTLFEDYLSASSTVVFDQLTNAGYTNNIFGIAKDDASALHQKQSKSINQGQRIIIGSGSTLAETNAANSNDLDEGQFLVVGDNGLEQGLRVPFAYTGGSNGETNLRFASIWKVQNTGSVGTVTVAWPKGVRNLYLVQSSDDVIDLSDDFVPMTDEVTIGGVVYNTATVTLDNYFTLAGFGNSPGGVTAALSYWYRADIDAENTGVGTDVTGWTDVWSGTTVAQVATTPLPKYAEGAADYFNFNSGINFTNQDQTLANLEVRTVTNNEYDIFTVTKEGLSGSGWARIFSALYDNAYLNGNIHYWDGIGINFWDNANAYERSNSPGGWIVPGGINPAVPFSATITNIMYHKFGDTNVSRGLNGGIYSTSNTHASVGFQNGGHAFGNTIFLGNGSDNPGITGHIGETIVYGAGSLSDTERRRVDSYLAIKYGITLGRVNTDHYIDANEEIVWDGAANAVYNNNIFGVAREDIGLFEQKVSKSVNPGSILTIATINDFVNPNQDAARTGFVSDHTYFLLGDNNLTDTPTEDIEIDGENYQRIQRSWLSQRQNMPGDLYFQADLSAYGVDFSVMNDVVMVIADDENFTTNVRTVSGTNAIGRWIHQYNFDADATNQYITYAVAEDQCLPEFVWSSPVSASGNTATGTIGGIEYTYTSDQIVNTSPAIFDSYNVFPASTGSSDIFSFPRTGHSVIRNIAVSNNTITFDEPVTDPILVFSSIGGPAGAVPVVFAQPIEVLWMDHRPGGSWFVAQDSETQITGHEGYAIVRIPGTHTSISFDYTAAENYANFMFGVAKERDCDTPPLIITNPMLINQVRKN